MNANLTKSCILLVEDVPAMRVFLRIALEGAGARVLEAGCLAEARVHLGRVRPTCVLLDLELPDGHGLALFDAIPDGVPVAALTADETEQTALKCHEAGCRTVIPKGRGVADLGARIAELEKVSAPRQLKAEVEPGLVAQYASYLHDTADEAMQALACGDLQGLRAIAHRLRGTALHFGFEDVDACARAVGPAVMSGDQQAISVAVQSLISVLNAPSRAVA